MATHTPIPYQHQEYPRWLHHASLPATKVLTAEEHALLGDGWYKSPADIPAVVATEPVASSPSTDAPDAPPASAAPAAIPEPDRASLESEALYSATVKAVTDSLGTSSRETLERILRYEEANPKGARKGIIEVVTKKLAGLVEAQ